jgi:type IV pilus assembly protein PilO
MAFSEAAQPDGGADGPVLFGVTLSPAILGGVFAVLGIGASAYVFVQFVKPKLDAYQTIKQEVADKELQREQVAIERQRLQKVYEARDLAKATQEEVLALFPSEETVTTLPIDLNQTVTSRYGRLLSFTPAGDGPQPVSDSSWGADANGKVLEQTINMSIEGDFDQTANILRAIERYQSMLVIDNLGSELLISNQPVRFDSKAGRLVPQGEPRIRIQTDFALKVLTPLSAEELAKQAAAAQADEEGADGEGGEE